MIVFAHNDLGCEEDGNCPFGVHATYDYAFETPFAQRGASQLMDVDETCSVSRGWSNADFVISNHFAANDQGKEGLHGRLVGYSFLLLTTVGYFAPIFKDCPTSTWPL